MKKTIYYNAVVYTGQLPLQEAFIVEDDKFAFVGKSEEALVQEALDSFTKVGAWASFEEECKGQIVPGMVADFVVLGENPFETEPVSLKDIPVLQTFLGGQKVKRAK